MGGCSRKYSRKYSRKCSNEKDLEKSVLRRAAALHHTSRLDQNRNIREPALLAVAPESLQQVLFPFHEARGYPQASWVVVGAAVIPSADALTLSPAVVSSLPSG